MDKKCFFQAITKVNGSNERRRTVGFNRVSSLSDTMGWATSVEGREVFPHSTLLGSCFSNLVRLK